MRRISFASAVLALIALGGLGTLSLVDLVDGPGTPRQEREARTPALPTDLGGLRRFVGQAKHHVMTRYALKDTFLRANAAWKVGLLGHPDTTDVMQGRDEFLFLASQDTVPLAQGLMRLTDAERADWQNHFRRVKDAFAEKGLPYMLIIGPNKHSIYPDKLPAWLIPATLEETRTADVMAQAQDVFGAAFVDLRPVLMQARTDHPGIDLYHPTDTHWNELGAGIAVHAALAPLNLDLDPPEHANAPLPRSGDLSRMAGAQDVPGPLGPILPRNWTCRNEAGEVLQVETIDPLMPRRFTCGSAEGRPEKIVVFTDSFGVGTIPYLAARFRTVEYIWKDDADPAEAASLRADLVLQVLVERKLSSSTPDRFLAEPGG